MANLDKAVATQLGNIEKRTGKTLAELSTLVRGSGLEKHGELVAMLKSKLGMGHGDANTLVHIVMKSDGTSAAAGLSGTEVLDGLYSGPKASLRALHDALLAAMRAFGPFEEAPKKAYVGYRRKKQFATIGPATKSEVEVGLNMKGVPGTPRLQVLPDGQMCSHRVRLATIAQVDAELLGWIRQAFEGAA